MFLPENQKKLTNVSVVSLKKFGRRYEVAVYPNKLYDYRNGITSSISDILHTDKIFTNVSKACPEQYLETFKKPRCDIIREILEKGSEQKSKETRDFELRKAENEIVHFVQSKVLDRGRYMSTDAVKKALGGFKVGSGSTKVQAQELVRKLVDAGYEKVKMTIEFVSGGDTARVAETFECTEARDNKIKIDTSLYRQVCSFCSKNAIRFRILHEDEVSEEEIC